MTRAISTNHRHPFNMGLCAQRTQPRQSGFTLVELLVALVLGLILILGVLNIFSSNRETFRVTENLARIQENTRAGFDFMTRDIREAGQNPCGTNLVANVIRKSGAIPWWADWNSGTMIGVDGSVDRTDIVAFGTTTNARVAGTDAVLVIRAAQDEKVVTNHLSTDPFEMTLQNVTGLVADDVVLACDMQGAAIFQLGTVSTSLKEISYKPSLAALNCSDHLGYPTPSDCATPPTKVFPAGAVLAKLSGSFWYIGYSASGKRSLYRTRIIKKTVAGVPTITTEPEEMVTGVQDLKMTYLTKNVSTDALATDWVAANDAVFAAAGAWSEVNTSQAVAVRIVMTLQSEENVGTDNLPIQRQLIHVVSLRSRDTLFTNTP